MFSKKFIVNTLFMWSLYIIIRCIILKAVNIYDSYIQSKACLAQLVEYRFCKPNVIGSTPLVGL